MKKQLLLFPMAFLVTTLQLVGQGELAFDDVLDPSVVDRLVVVQTKQEESYGQPRERKKIYTYGHFKGSKELLLVENSDGYAVERYDYEVDPNGNVLAQYFVDDEKKLMNSYLYSEELLVQSSQYISSKLANIKYCSYNNKRQLIYDSTNFIRGDTLSYYATRRYTYQHGHQVAYVSFSSYSSSGSNRHTYSYDSEGQLLAETSYNPDGSVYGTWDYEYDNSGFISRRYVTGIGKPERRVLYENTIEVDEKGNWIVLERSGSLANKVVRTITYR